MPLKVLNKTKPHEEQSHMRVWASTKKDIDALAVRMGKTHCEVLQMLLEYYRSKGAA